MHKLTAHLFNGIEQNHTFLSGLQSPIRQLFLLMHYCQYLSPKVNHLCGKMNVYKDTFTVTTFTIQPLSGYTSVITFLRFKMLFSYKCVFNKMAVFKHITPPQLDIYCGTMPPWTEMCPCQTIDIELELYIPQPPTVMVMSYFMRKKTVLIKYASLETWFSQSWNEELPSRYQTHQITSVFILTEKWQLIGGLMNNSGN